MNEGLKGVGAIPCIIEEKVACFWESIAYADLAISILKKEEIKGLYTFERGFRKALGAYPLGIPNSLCGNANRAWIKGADSLVLQAWTLLSMPRKSPFPHFEELIDCLIRAGKLIADVYGLELDNSGIVKRTMIVKPSNRRRLELAKVEPFRLRHMY
ncbi:hypothetical protein [Dyadobacter sp. CY351]|uniref:hypothetical protein n=1 Tax=Dyadobacter sp. CY351 TaxID=2909337 RepID=UPI001F1EB530|nr:hypothetical protein [Dyadobacter sp. CY351]MCF2520947.1 hypothetical protein [Dyadobacter sp. CY351]